MRSASTVKQNVSITPLHPPGETEREAKPAAPHTAASKINVDTVMTSLWTAVGSMVWMPNLPSLRILMLYLTLFLNGMQCHDIHTACQSCAGNT